MDSKTSNRGNATTFLNYVGLGLIVLGIILLLSSLFNLYSLDGKRLSVIFFTVMVGFAFVFPDLLEDQNSGISTMRLVVFMMVNVICILLLQMGWDAHSLCDIKLDANWMGVIAFVFGAKATQTYFESKLAVPPVVQPNQPATGVAAPNSADMINQAIQQNQSLKTRFPNIVSMLLGSFSSNGHNLFCVDIHLNDSNKADIPDHLPVIAAGSQYSVPTQIITDIGDATTNATGGDTLTNSAIKAGMSGTLGCILTDSTQALYALTCCHVFTNDKWIPDYTGVNVPPDAIRDTATKKPIGTWVFGIMNSSFDIAYARIDDPLSVQPSKMGKPRDVDDMDILNKTPVSFKGASTAAGEGFICNNFCTRTVGYGKTAADIDNLILISTAGNTSPSKGGDSGALVYTSDDKSPIGILIGADKVFSYVIPITSILALTRKIIY